jgi:isopenicillin N synthase-like dioxygenase
MDGTPGLEVRKRGGGWIPVSAPVGEFVINFGEMLEMWTQKRVVATPHRVVGGDAERMSIPLFYNPNAEKILRQLGQIRSFARSIICKSALMKPICTSRTHHDHLFAHR